MSRLPWGRKARVYVSRVGFGVDNLAVVRRAQDIGSTDEADDLVADARDLDCKLHGQGAKLFAVDFEILLERGDDGEDVVVLKGAYDEEAVIYVLVTREGLDVEAGDGVRYKAVVLGFPESFPLNAATTVRLTLKQADPDVMPERVDTPYTYTDPALLMEDGESLLTEDGELLLLES